MASSDRGKRGSAVNSKQPDVWDIIDNIDNTLKEQKERDRTRKERERAAQAEQMARIEQEERQLLQVQHAELDRREELKRQERQRWQQSATLDMKHESIWMAHFESAMAMKSGGTPLRTARTRMNAFYRDELPPTAAQLEAMAQRQKTAK